MPGGVPGDQALISIREDKKTFLRGHLESINTPSPDRVKPFCPLSIRCGGCQWQETTYDAQLTWDGLAQPALEHGVTTVIPGNCSLSLAPLKVEHREFLGAVFRQIEEMPKSAFDAGIEWTWQSMAEYNASISRHLGINVAPLAGHSLLRLWVLGYASRDRASTPEELRALADLLRECLDGGALGMSTSFSDVDHEFRPVPSRLATMKELNALCAVLGERNRPLQLLPEFWAADLLATRIDIMAELSLRHEIPVTFSPLFESASTPGLVDAAIERLELHAARGARVTAQMQTRPLDMTFDMSQISAVFAAMPTWMGTLLSGPEAIKKAVKPGTARRRSPSSRAMAENIAVINIATGKSALT